MERSDDNTNHCRGPTPCDLTPSSRAQSSEQESSYLTASKRHPSIPYSRNTPRSISGGTRPYTFPRSTKHVYTSLAGSQDFSKICWRLEICSAVLRTQRKPHWVSSSFGSIILAASRHRLSWEAKQRDAAVVGSFTPVSLFVDGDDQFANLSVLFQNAMPLDTHESAKPFDILNSVNSLSNFSQLDISSDLTVASERLLMHSSTEAFICEKLKHPA